MDKALIVIDMLEDFIAPDGKLTCGPAGQAIVPALQAEIAAAREDGTPVIYLCDNHREDDPEFQMFPPHCVAGTSALALLGR